MQYAVIMLKKGKNDTKYIKH